VIRELGQRGDIIKRIHRGLAEQRIERGVADFALDEGDTAPPVIGRLVARGLDDELRDRNAPPGTTAAELSASPAKCRIGISKWRLTF
jgi:type IV secretory pathway VirD2 relaxase